MEIHRFDVTVAAEGIELEKALETGEYETHRCVILHPDILAAEQSGPKYGLGTVLADRGLDYTTLWCWFALQRMHVDVNQYPLWKQRVLSLDKITDPSDAGADAVDPTTPALGTGSP